MRIASGYAKENEKILPIEAEVKATNFILKSTPTFIKGVRYDGYPEFEPMVSTLKQAQKVSGRKK